MKHALLSASGASKWLNCPPSARLEEMEPKGTTRYATEGTLAHEKAEEAIDTALFGGNPVSYDDLEMRGYVEDYTNFIKQKVVKYPNAKIALEAKVDFSMIVPEGFGTVDVLIIADDVIEVVDLKYGKGVRVSAYKNPQLRLYAFGALKYAVNPKEVITTVYQPRLNNISREELSVMELNRWAYTTVAPKAKKAWAGDGELNTGDHCRFCKVRVKCKEYNKGKLTMIRELLKSKMN